MSRLHRPSPNSTIDNESILVYCNKHEEGLRWTPYPPWGHVRVAKGGKPVKRIYRGVVDGNVIRLGESSDLPLGSQAIITLTTLKKEEQKEITDRQVELLRRGFNLGKKLYTERNDLYAR